MLSGMPWFLVMPLAALCERTPKLTPEEFDTLEDRGIFGVDLMSLRDHLWEALKGNCFAAQPIEAMIERLENSPPGTIEAMAKVYQITPANTPALTPGARLLASLHWTAGKGLK